MAQGYTLTEIAEFLDYMRAEFAPIAERFTPELARAAQENPEGPVTITVPAASVRAVRDLCEIAEARAKGLRRILTDRPPVAIEIVVPE